MLCQPQNLFRSPVSHESDSVLGLRTDLENTCLWEPRFELSVLCAEALTDFSSSVFQPSRGYRGSFWFFQVELNSYR